MADISGAKVLAFYVNDQASMMNNISMEIDFDAAVILPSAGHGERMESPGQPSKQLRSVLHKPLFMYPVEEYYKLAWIKRIVLVIHPYDLNSRLLLLPYRDKIVIAIGGDTRHKSIRAGLTALQKDALVNTFHVVLVHDAVRPFVPRSLVEQLALAAHVHGAAGSVRPLVSTIIKPDENHFLGETLDRSLYVASEMPQAFQFNVLTNAYANCPSDELKTGTECLKLAHLYAGVRPKLIVGPSDLWKVTLKKDFYAAIGCIQERSLRVCIVAPRLCDTAIILESRLQEVIAFVERFTELPKTPNQPFGDVEPYTSVVVFYPVPLNENLDSPPLDFRCEQNLRRTGLLIRVIDCVRAGERRQDRFPERGIAVIRRGNREGDSRIVHLIHSMVMAPQDTFSQQLLFV